MEGARWLVAYAKGDTEIVCRIIEAFCQIGRLTEPFNLYYELRVGLLENTKDWDLDLILTNNETFELERHYQPTYLAECFYYPTDNLGVTLGVGYKPSGTFHIAAGYYQTFIKTSVCYRW